MLATNGQVIDVVPISTLTNSSSDPATLHYWRLTLGLTDIQAEAVALDGTVYIDITDTVGA
jgi:hypothetical protein